MSTVSKTDSGIIEEAKPIPKPKKPRKWDGWLSVAFISICIILVCIFARTEFDLNARVAAGLIPVGLCYYTYFLFIGRRRRDKKYDKDVNEYNYNIRMDSQTRHRSTQHNHRKEMARQQDLSKKHKELEIEKIVEENLRKATSAWDTRDFEDLLPGPGRARVGKMFKR
jgi:hypothetical protein